LRDQTGLLNGKKKRGMQQTLSGKKVPARTGEKSGRGYQIDAWVDGGRSTDRIC
jgi:hypothetical protein